MPEDCEAIAIETEVLRSILLAGVEGITEIDVNLFARDMPETLDEDPSPHCIVVVGNERLAKNMDDPRTNSTIIYEYPVLVLLVKKIAMTRTESDPWKKRSRQKIRDILSRHLLLGSQGVVRRCHYDPEPYFMAAGYAHDYKVSAQQFSYRCEKNRTA